MGLFGKKKETAAPVNGQQHAVTLNDGVTYIVRQTVDCIGDNCPRPQLMTRKAVAGVGAGGVVEILLDNPTSVEALPPMCSEMAATHLATVKEARGWKVYIRKD